jgi:general secretion pathway protein D
MDAMMRKAGMVKIRILETGNRKISVMRKITVISLLLLFICPSLLLGEPVNPPVPNNTAIITTDNGAKAAPVVTNSNSSKNTRVVNTQPSGQQGTQQNRPETILPAAQNALPNQPGTPASVPAVSPKGQLPSGSVIQPRPQQTQPKPDTFPGKSGRPAEALTLPDPHPMQSVALHRTGFVSQGNVSLNFDDADIYSVIQTVFGEILRVNYIIDARVKGRVTFRSVSPVAREKVLPLMEVILRLNGVAVIEESELYRIIPISDLSREPSEIKIGRKIIASELKGKAVLQIVPLNYMQSSEIVRLINPFVSTNAVIVDVPKANHIIIADTDANVKRILQLIEYFDSEMKEKKGVRVFVYRVQNVKAKEIATMLQQVFLGAKSQTTDTRSNSSPEPTSPSSALQTQSAKSVVAGSRQGGNEGILSDVVKIFADEKLNAVVILGTREDYDVIKQTIIELDLVPRQVLIEGTIASIQLTDKMSLGLAWSIKTNFSALGLDMFNISFNPSSLTVNPSAPTADGLNVIGVDSSASVRAVITALATQSKAKLMAAPHIMVSENNEARIQVGQQVPIVTSETYTTTTTVPTRTIQYKDIGIILKVKPLINDSGLINLQISQEVSTYSTIKLYADEDQIILNKTEATTNLVVKNGHTIVIGGLIREDDSKAREGIPWLYKIPVLGYLFGNTTKENNRTELVILLTPYIIKDQEDAAAVTNKYADKITDENINKELKQNIHRKINEPKEETPKK